MIKEVETELKIARNIGNIPAAVSALTDLSDYIEYGKWDESTYKETLNTLLDIFFNNELHQDLLMATHRAIELLLSRAYYPLDKNDLKILIKVLETSQDAGAIDAAIFMLSYTFNPEFIPLIDKFLAHPAENVRFTAQEAIRDLKSRLI